MSLLKQKNWWIWLLVFLFTQSFGAVIMASFLNLYEKDAWYRKWYYWVIGALLFLFPFLIMLNVFFLQATCLVAAKLKVPGKEIYLTPYTWILCLIIPIIGWTFLIVMYFYLLIEIVIMLYRGNAEEYIK